jgi:hypothetical protein
MRETTMMRNAKYIAMALGAVVLLAGCNSKSPTAPKPTPVPAFNISLTPETTTATAGDSVLVTAQVTTGSANAPDGTSVTFDVSGGTFPPTGATEAVRTTTGGGTSIHVTSSGGTATILGRVPGDSDQTSVIFAGVAPTPTPTGPPDYTPVIYALTPNAGPFEGGTRVTISGTGFQAPVQVLFTTPANGTFQAQVVSTTYTEIVCISPSITPGQPTAMVTAAVTVTNINNGKVSPGVNFQYGVTMFISSFTPMEGPADVPTTVTIFGQGFVAPVSVVASGVAWDVLSVAGSEIVVRTKPLDNPHVCDGGSTTFTVTNINSNQTYDSPGSFSYRGVRPLITSVRIGATNLFAQCGGTCPACSAQTITINGSGFQTTSTMTVTLDGAGGGSIGPLVANVTSANTMTVYVLDASVLVPLTTPCTGGTRNISTPIDVSVRNVRYDCSDRLNGALVMVPCDTTTCTPSVVPTPTPTPVPVPTLAIISTNPVTVSEGATLPAPVSFTVTVTPAQAITLDVLTAGDFAFDTPPATVTTNASGIGTLTLTVPAGVTAGQSATATVSYLTATPVVATVNIGP